MKQKGKDKNLWRGRLSEEIKPGIKKFISSLEADQRIVESDLNVAEAHNLMLYKQGLLNLSEISQILKGFENARKEWEAGKLNLDTDEIDIHPLLEKYVIDLCGIEVGGKTHLGKSRNDQVVTDVRIYLRQECLNICGQLQKFITLLLQKSSLNIETVMPGYTHTQEAQVITYAHYLLSYVDLFLRDLERFEQSYPRINLNPLGAAALAGTSVNIDRNYTAKLLGFDDLLENSLDAVSNRDFIIEFAGNISILMSNLSRMADDIILWSTTEFGIIKLADELSDVSSAMPQKKNPCPIEMIRGKTGRVFSSLQNLLTIVKGTPTGYNKDLQETKPPIWESIDVIKASLEVIDRAVETLYLDKKRCLELTLNNPLTAMDLAEYLTIKGYLSFREAHFLVGNLVKEMVAQNKKFSELEASQVTETAKKILGKEIIVNNQELKAVTDPCLSILKRDSQGGPSPKESKRMIRKRQQKISRHQKILSQRREKLENSNNLLTKTVSSLLCKN